MSDMDLSINSTFSDHIDGNESAETLKIKQYVKDLLKSRIFLGNYVERRLINRQIGYRDIVLISAAETELRRDMLTVVERLRVLYNKSHWIGISDSQLLSLPAGLCLATEIDNKPFGPFWFQIKSIKFRLNETIIVLKCLRYISEEFLEIEPLLSGTKDVKAFSNLSDVRHDMKAKNCTDFITSLKDLLSLTNIKEFFIFIFAFIIAVFTGSTSFVNFLGNFVLALIRELSIFIKNFTPMFLGILDFLGKIVGGFYILLAMVFKPSNPPGINSRKITYDKVPTNFRRREFD